MLAQFIICVLKLKKKTQDDRDLAFEESNIEETFHCKATRVIDEEIYF